jgi:hypothetical protein
MVSLIPQKKVLIPRYSEFCGRANSELNKINFNQGGGIQFLTGFFWIFSCMYFIQHCFICRPSDSTVSEDAGIEPRTVATSALAVRRSSHSATLHLIHTRLTHPHSATSHPYSSRLYLIHTRLHLIHTRLHLIHTRLHLIHTRLHFIHTRRHLIHTRLHLIHTRLHLVHFLLSI